MKDEILGYWEMCSRQGMALQYGVDLPVDGETDEWLALMRHHGAPTRLLDFTYSPYVAAYFAFEDAEPRDSVAIWAVNTSWCAEASRYKYPEVAPSIESYEHMRDSESFNQVFMPTEKEPYKLALSTNPYRLNERLTVQRGNFMCPGDVCCSFMANLAAMAEPDELIKNVVKYIIPTGQGGETRNEALQHLHSMNISRATLFPGLDGFAQSLAPRTRALFMQMGEHGR